MLPPEMEGRTFSQTERYDTILPRLGEKPQHAGSEARPALPPRRTTDNSESSSVAGVSWRDVHSPSTVRAVTPDSTDARFPRRLPGSPQRSPRSLNTARVGQLTGNGDDLATVRRQGVVFRDDVDDTPDSAPSSPPSRSSTFRPRTHTLDGLRQQPPVAAETRQRVGSVGSPALHMLMTSEDLRSSVQAASDLAASLSVPQYRVSDLQSPAANISKEKKSSSRSRLVKRVSSRADSPMLSPSPCVDSLPGPIPTTDANRILLLMKTLCGRMRGDIEYRKEPNGPWNRGLCYVDEEKGSLMFDSGDLGPFHTPIIPDLRGCRVTPVGQGDTDAGCLEIVNSQWGVEILLRPLIVEEYDLWLATLLCWQQVRTGGTKSSHGRSNPPVSMRADMKRRASSTGLRDAAIIKVGKLMLWDKGVATSPRALVKRPSTRDLRTSQGDWKRVSCILQDNGEFKLMTENDVTVLAIIELSQLARCAIQQLDRSVLEEVFCIGIFPIYAPGSSRLSILRPVYISLDSRVLFEVWFVLLRAFTVPPIYGLPTEPGTLIELTDHTGEVTTDHFRVEKTVTVRVTEAKLRIPTQGSQPSSYDRSSKLDSSGIEANYLAEVILDGEVRARTTTKAATKNPFWREDCEFTDLPSTVPFLTVLLKRVDGSLETVSRQFQASVGVSKGGSLVEVICGNVDIPLHQIERGKDHEQWHNIYDERQQSVGTMLIKVHHEELVVMTSKEYQPISELLHRFSTGLTAQITEAIQGNSRRLAEVFLNIFQVSGNATEWLMNLVEDEIDGIGNQAAMKKPRFSRRLKSNDSVESTGDREHIVRDMGKSLAGEANLLFRGNSLLTQALEFHMRRLGKEYLDDILSEKLNEINEANINCEVDPSKLVPGQDLQKNWDKLMRLISEIWECIAPSATRIPQELRHILKYIRAVAEDRYGDFLRTVTYTSVSGFLFLRFICPAILNPKLFGLLRDHPRPHAQRTLTLIAKCLQALANLSTIGKKETWTQPMNHFINTQRQSLKDFIDGVCAIPMERNTITVPASYSTPITILGRLSPLLREGFPSLPYLIDHPRNFAMLVKLWTDANPASSDGNSGAGAAGGSSARVFEGDLLEFHNLCTAIQRRADERHILVENLRHIRLAAAADEDDIRSVTDPSPGPMSAADADRLSELADVFDRSSLLNATPSSFGSSTAVWTENELAAGSTTSSTLRPPGSSGSELDNPRDVGRSRGKESIRHPSATSEWHLGGSPASTMRGLKNGMHARKLLSGFMRKTGARTSSPDVPAGAREAVGSPEDEGGNEWLRDRDRQADTRPKLGRNGNSVERLAELGRSTDRVDRDEERSVVRDRKKGLGLGGDAGRQK